MFFLKKPLKVNKYLEHFSKRICCQELLSKIAQSGHTVGCNLVESEVTIILKSWRYCAPENKNEIFQRKTQYYYLKKEELEEKERDFKKILG